MMEAIRAELEEFKRDVNLWVDELIAVTKGADEEVVSQRTICYGAQVSPEFKAAVLWIEAQLGLSADNLMACMAFETGGTFSPSVKNAAGSSGTGLIQFMAATYTGMVKAYPVLKNVAASHEALGRLDAVKQLTFVYYYFKAFGSNLAGWSLEDTYMAILFPKAIGKPLSWAMPWAAGSLAYKQNAGLDLNKDKVITKAEAAAGVQKRLILGNQLKG